MGNTTGAITEAGAKYPSEAPEFTFWVLGVQSVFYCVVLYRPSFVCSSFYMTSECCLYTYD